MVLINLKSHKNTYFVGDYFQWWMKTHLGAAQWSIFLRMERTEVMKFRSHLLQRHRKVCLTMPSILKNYNVFI